MEVAVDLEAASDIEGSARPPALLLLLLLLKIETIEASVGECSR